MYSGATQRKGESCRRIHSPVFALQGRHDVCTPARHNVRANHAGEFIRRYSPLSHVQSQPAAALSCLLQRSAARNPPLSHVQPQQAAALSYPLRRSAACNPLQQLRYHTVQYRRYRQLDGLATPQR